MEVQPYIRFNFYLTSSLGSSDANEAVQISLVQPGPSTDLKILHQFKPRFTYPVFGEEERIFGYKGLEIHLRFAAHDLRPNVMTSYEKRFKPVGDTVALDINKTLRQWMPACEYAMIHVSYLQKNVIVHTRSIVRSDTGSSCLRESHRVREVYSE